jgi:hypothetical protein
MAMLVAALPAYNQQTLNSDYKPRVIRPLRSQLRPIAFGFRSRVLCVPGSDSLRKRDNCRQLEPFGSLVKPKRRQEVCNPGQVK